MRIPVMVSMECTSFRCKSVAEQLGRHLHLHFHLVQALSRVSRIW
jgi:hypothetical protein